MRNFKIEMLLSGKSIISKEPGDNMIPLIKSKQPVLLAPNIWQDTEIVDMVYCKVRENLYTHLVKDKNDKNGCLIIAQSLSCSSKREYFEIGKKRRTLIQSHPDKMCLL